MTIMNIDKKELEALKGVFYAMVDMPEKQRKAFRDMAKSMNKALGDEVRQEGRDKTRAVINSILDDSFAEQDRLAALDDDTK